MLLESRKGSRSPLTKNGSVAGRPRETALSHNYRTSRASPVNCSRWLGPTPQLDTDSRITHVSYRFNDGGFQFGWRASGCDNRIDSREINLSVRWHRDLLDILLSDHNKFEDANLQL